MGSRKSLTGRLRLLQVRELLLQQSDAEHGVTVDRLRELLSENGIDASYNSVRDDVRALKASGLDIAVTKGDKRGCRVMTRGFTDAEVRLVANAVQSCKFISEAQSVELVGKLAELASVNVQDDLVKEVCVDVRVRMGSIDAYDNVDAISRSIRRGSKIRFKYMSYGFDLKRHARHGGKVYEAAPAALVYSNDNYYMCALVRESRGQCEVESVRTYRVDRMADLEEDVCLLDRSERATVARIRAEIKHVVARSLDMYNSDPIVLRLDVEEAGMDMVVDRFGLDAIEVRWLPGRKDVRRVSVRTSKSPVLNGWLAMVESIGVSYIGEGPADQMS